jgi:hypothetical protein
VASRCNDATEKELVRGGGVARWVPWLGRVVRWRVWPRRKIAILQDVCSWYKGFKKCVRTWISISFQYKLHSLISLQHEL